MEKKITLFILGLGVIFLGGYLFFSYNAKNNLPKKESVKIVECAPGSTDFTCYQDYFTAEVKEKGIDATFVDLKNKYEKDSYVRSQCHPLTHVIGHASADLYPDVTEAFKHGDPVCWSGYYHGVMEKIVETVGEKNVVAKLDGICSGIPGKANYSFDYYNCVHGLGHGLMDIENDNLFSSLTLCDNLKGGWEKSSCYGGVFMENVITDGIVGTSEYLRPKEPLYPCNAVGDSYKTSCYLMQTSYMLKVSNYDFSKVFALCRESDKGYADICFQSLGRDASGQSISDITRTKATCDLGANFEEKSNCLIGAVKDFVSYYHSDKQALSLCKAVSSDLQKICSNTVDSYYRSFQ